MLIQISSGLGPVECEIAVYKLFQYFCQNDISIEQVRKHKGKVNKAYTSITFSTTKDYSNYVGTVQWICKSSYRRNHHRKNWFIDVTVLPILEVVEDIGNIEIDTFRSSGKGGQNVNKVETGVRIRYVESNITVTCIKHRTQLQNKKEALKKLRLILIEGNKRKEQQREQIAWQRHTQLVRGNSVATFVGEAFVLDH